MDKMSLISIIFVSIPESILILITTLVAAGYKDVVSLKNKRNAVKLITCTLIIALSAVFIRTFSTNITHNAIITFTATFFIIIAMYRYKPISCLMGYLLAMIVILVSEGVVMGVVMNLFSITVEQVFSSDLTRILLSLPNRFLQISTIFIILKIKSFNLKYTKLTPDEWIQTVLFILMIFSSLFTIEKGARNIHNDSGIITNLIINTCILVLFSGWMIFRIFSLRKRTVIGRKIHSLELSRIKTLLKQGRTDYVIELIDLALNNREGVSK